MLALPNMVNRQYKCPLQLRDMLNIVEFNSGTCIIGDSCDQDVIDYVKSKFEQVQLIVCDPPYGNVVSDKWDKTNFNQHEFATWMIDWVSRWNDVLEKDCAFYVWGGIGSLDFRPYLEFLSRVEIETTLKLANLITWKKKRAYGVSHNYLFTREECAYLFNGVNPKKPKVFNVPYLDEIRGYDGYNKKYPAKSKFYRRTNVWADVTEMMRNKVHTAQKPEKLYEIIIEAHTNKGDLVLDMFAGSGTCAIAAINTGRKFIVVESNKEIAKNIIERIKQYEQRK